MPRTLRPLLALVALLTACVHLPRPALLEAAPTDERRLAQAVEQFYLGTKPEDLKQAVDAALAAGPNTALAHELAAALAQLEGREDAQIDHLLSALEDTRDDDALLHLHTLSLQELTFAQRDRFTGLCEALAASHPDPWVRAAANYHLTILHHAAGRAADAERALHAIPGRLDFDVVGTWDNDSGKAFDLELDAESRPGDDQTYEGRLGPIRWRAAPPVDPRGRLPLDALMSPTRWVAAMAKAQPVVRDAGDYALAVTTTDPLKVWVDGKLLFAAQELRRSSFDHLVLPVHLGEGVHTVLIKSAHRDGPWQLSARLVPLGEMPTKVETLDDAVDWHVRQLPKDSPRTRAHRIAWAHLGAGGTTTVHAADAWAREAPNSVLARVWQVDALWYNQERGRTADALARADDSLGTALPFVRLRQTRFHQQQGLKQKTRERLLALVKQQPGLEEAWEQLQDAYRSEGWLEDEWRTNEERLSRFGESPALLADKARLQQRLGRRSEAQATLEGLLAKLPLQGDILERLALLHLDAGELDAARALTKRRLDTWATDLNDWMRLADLERRSGNPQAAEAAFEAASQLSPASPQPWERRGEARYQAGDLPGAVAAWHTALALNPEDEALANRLDFLAPEARGPWMADVPDEAAIEALIATRNDVKQKPGADVAWLLDHEVSQLNPDGSTNNIVTLIMKAFNEQGRDRIIRQRLPAGRLRVLHAYSIDEKGLRTEAGGERNHVIFFRSVQPGATIVLQYRYDQSPSGYLSRFLTKSWTFQSVAEQRVKSQFILWTPLATKLHEVRVGGVTRSEDKRGEQLRIVWAADDVPPLTPEPGMPTALELAANIRLSSVPDWKTWLSWEQALLEGVFRDSPELDALAKELEQGPGTTEEKLKRIHRYVMEEIRYQQDYETFIAGVKPHPAPMVLERKYGDCKDKAVLFIELAKKLGVEAHFALVRTRMMGPVVEAVPMQQFNHAIVYVPKQPGLTEGRFFDPTATQLDLDVVRHDDVGTMSLVFDPVRGEHAWREIPFQPPQANRERATVKMTVAGDGTATGTLTLDGRGRQGSALRRTALNEEVLAQVAQRVAAVMLPNATASEPKALEAKSLEAPAVLQMDVASRTFARKEGDTLRIRLPSSWTPKASFALATRRYPLLLGTPSQYETVTQLELPDGFTPSRLPENAEVKLPCLEYHRTLKQAGRSIEATQGFRVICDRIAETEYGVYREKVEAMLRLMEDELVLAPVKGGKKPPKAKAPAAR